MACLGAVASEQKSCFFPGFRVAEMEFRGREKLLLTGNSSIPRTAPISEQSFDKTE